MSEAHAAHDDHHGQLPGTIGHVSPWQTLVKVLVTLLILTVITVAIAQVDLGRLNVVGAIGVACVKASVVTLWFMHLRYDKRFNFFILIGSFALVAWMIGYILFDTMLYQHNVQDYKRDRQAPATP
ncbi:MAG: cytochrome C oxidase subunit IV family protein [Planctomycetes bacterium]|nr:cytochrome C oxidase subunit IV family protein [Planctomycetota bacterium]